MQAAAGVGELFGMDPVEVLAETDRMKSAVRYAAAGFIFTERRKAANKNS